MVNALLALLSFQLVGEIVARTLQIPVPGPVIGMLLLFLALHLHGKIPEQLERTVQSLLGNLALLFVPAGVGVIVHLELLKQDWWRLLITILASTTITLLATALVMQGLIALGRRFGRKEA